MSTQITRRIFDVNKDDKNGGLLSSNNATNHRSNTDIDTKLNCDNARRTREYSLFLPRNQSDFWTNRANDWPIPLSHQTAAVQRFSLTVNAHESAFSNAQTTYPSREEQCNDAKRVSFCSIFGILKQLSRWEKNSNFV